MIVFVTPTIMSGGAVIRWGAVVRWYAGETDTAVPQVSASRDGVLVDGFLHHVAADVMAAAEHVRAGYAPAPGADVDHLATHRRRGIAGPVEPTVREGR